MSIARIFSEALKIPEASISDETSPDNTPQWDSLQAMNLVTALEEAYNIRLSTREIISMRNVAIVRRVLLSKGCEGV